MSRRTHHLRPTNRLRTSAKLALAVAGTTLATLVVLLTIFFNISKQESSFAESLMVFESADVLQDTSAVLRGSINEQILGVVVETSGNKNPVKLSTITFGASGTTKPVIKNIENARLWFTGKKANFNTSLQLGQTVPRISEASFDMVVNRALNPGKNYFWLTFDIKSDATDKNGTVDAECVSLQIGTNSYVPVLSSPAGKRKILSNISYFSTGIPETNKITAWNTKRDGSGISPTKLESSQNSYFIQSGHSLVNNSILFLPMIVIEKHGSLKNKEGLKSNYLQVTDGGIFQQEYVITDNNPVEFFKMENGGNYIHLTNGKLPGIKKYFSPNSNQCFYKYGKETFSENIKWGNVLINSSEAEAIDVGNVFKNIQGDLEFHKTGINNFLYSGISDTINIGGNLIFSGGTFIAANEANTSLVINVSEDLIIKSGNFYDSNGKRNSNCTLNINGDVLLLAGDFNFNKNKEGLSQINFLSKTIKKSYWSQNSLQVELGNVTIMPGKELVIQSGKLGEINRRLTVENGAKLMCATFIVSGNGMFVLKENATIGIGSPQGINSVTASGNIQTQERYFDSRAHYQYYTGSTPQQTGIFSTAPENGQVKTMVIKKDKPSDNVLLSQDFEVTDQLLISMGQLDKKRNKITLSKLSDSFTTGKSN
jgi:hypothetical protein